MIESRATDSPQVEPDNQFGEQLGQAVRELLTGKALFLEAQRPVVKRLPKPMQRAVALFMFKHNLLPEPIGFNPLEAWSDFLHGIGRDYFENYVQIKHPHVANLLFDDQAHPTSVNNPNNQTNGRVVWLWSNQVRWARNVLSNQDSSDTATLAEANAILVYQDHLASFFNTALKKSFVRKGLQEPSLIQL